MRLVCTFILACSFLVPHMLRAETVCFDSKASHWNADASLSLVSGPKHSIVRAVRELGVPISLGLRQFKDAKAFFPFGQDIRFTYMRAEKMSHIADYYFLSWGLNYQRFWNLGLHAGYEILLTIFKDEISDNEIAITYHDFYLAPYIGVSKVFLEKLYLNSYVFANVHLPSHELKHIFFEVGIGGGIPL